MRRILKRIIKRDSRGVVIHQHDELTVDDGTDIGVLSVETFETCTSCHRPLKPDDPRGMCQICLRQTCSCGVSCGLCTRNLCGQCRHGVISISGQVKLRLTVCPICLPKAKRAAVLANELAIENSKSQLLHSSLLDRLPGIGIVRQVAELKLLKRLEELEGEMRR